MKGKYEYKIAKIISEEFDLRMESAVIAYIVDKGWSNVRQITDDMIENQIDDGGLMSKGFQQALIIAARRICNECDLFDDFIPYIKKFTYIRNCVSKELVLDRYDYEKVKWCDLLDLFDVEVEEDDFGNLVLPEQISGYFILD